jgi:hypothetical protein
MTSLKFLQEIDAWLSFNNSPSKEQISELRKDIKNHIIEQFSNNEVVLCGCNNQQPDPITSGAVCENCGGDIIGEQDENTN